MNFDFLKPFPQLNKLYRACSEAEEMALSFLSQSCGTARSALKFVVTLIYRSAIGDATSPTTLFEKMNDPEFESCLNDETLLSAMHTVRKNGNLGAHGEPLSSQVACETLEQLRFAVRQQIDKLQTLYGGLVQECFG